MDLFDKYFERYAWALDILTEKYGKENVVVARCEPEKFGVVIKHKGKEQCLLLYLSKQGLKIDFKDNHVNRRRLAKIDEELEYQGG